MPGMNGLELLKVLENSGRRVKSILCTGCVANIENHGEFPQPDEFLSKPYDLADLQAAIDRVVSN